MRNVKWTEANADEPTVGQFVPPLRHAVIIASLDRPQVLLEAIRGLEDQSRRPDLLILSVVKPDDLPSNVERSIAAITVIGPGGLTRQRNRGIDQLPDDIDLVTFLDDDAVLATDYLRQAQIFATAQPGVVLFSGRMLRDGGVTGEVSMAHSEALLVSASWQESPPSAAPVNVSGSNMNVRASLLASERFDERLPAYGWLEDRDFSARARRHGGVRQASSCVLVHRGVAGGRMSPRRLGCSQIVNPHYLWRKGSLRATEMASLWARVLGGNVRRLLRGDRAGERLAQIRGHLDGIIAISTRAGDPSVIERLP